MDDLSGPDLCHCFANRRSSRYLSRLYDRHLGPAQVTTSQFSILSVLGHNPGIRIADMARIMVMERTTLLRALKPLQQAGWVTSEASRTGRGHEMSLTPSGQHKVSEAAPLWAAAQAEFEDAFGRDRALRLRSDVLDMAARA